MNNHSNVRHDQEFVSLSYVAAVLLPVVGIGLGVYLMVAKDRIDAGTGVLVLSILTMALMALLLG